MCNKDQQFNSVFASELDDSCNPLHTYQKVSSVTCGTMLSKHALVLD